MRNVILACHLILIAMGTGMSLANLLNLLQARAEAGERFAALAALRKTLARLADIVIALIWVTGAILAWRLAAEGADIWSGWFLAKLAFVVLLTLAHGLVRATAGRMARTGDRSLLPRLTGAVATVFGSALASIVLAVAAFG
ncbi:MAG: hypothetical protein AB7S41_15275 [Parvibaculaceae bacterium]